MILPMMGLLFAIFAVGLLGAVVLLFVRPWRWLVPFALIPVLASVSSLLICWGLAFSLEHLFASQKAGGIGFFGGYVCGGLLGAGAGAFLARKFAAYFGQPNHSFETDGSAAAQLKR
jgi:hypothetical protein